MVMIDQTRLPNEEIYVTCGDYKQVADAIRTMIIRGAPRDRVAAAMGVAIGIGECGSSPISIPRVGRNFGRNSPGPDPPRSTSSGPSIA